MTLEEEGKTKDEQLSIQYSHPAWTIRALQSLIKNGREEKKLLIF